MAAPPRVAGLEPSAWAPLSAGAPARKTAPPGQLWPHTAPRLPVRIAAVSGVPTLHAGAPDVDRSARGAVRQPPGATQHPPAKTAPVAAAHQRGQQQPAAQQSGVGLPADASVRATDDKPATGPTKAFSWSAAVANTPRPGAAVAAPQQRQRGVLNINPADILRQSGSGKKEAVPPARAKPKMGADLELDLAREFRPPGCPFPPSLSPLPSSSLLHVDHPNTVFPSSPPNFPPACAANRGPGLERGQVEGERQQTC